MPNPKVWLVEIKLQCGVEILFVQKSLETNPVAWNTLKILIDFSSSIKHACLTFDRSIYKIFYIFLAYK